MSEELIQEITPIYTDGELSDLSLAMKVATGSGYIVTRFKLNDILPEGLDLDTLFEIINVYKS